MNPGDVMSHEPHTCDINLVELQVVGVTRPISLCCHHDTDYDLDDKL